MRAITNWEWEEETPRAEETLEETLRGENAALRFENENLKSKNAALKEQLREVYELLKQMFEEDEAKASSFPKSSSDDFGL